MPGKDETEKMRHVEKNDSKSRKREQIKPLMKKKKEKSRDDTSASWEKCVMGKEKGSFPC